MSELYLPWLQLSAVLPFVGALAISRVRNVEAARRWSLVFCSVVLASAIGSWQDFYWRGAELARDPWDLMKVLTGREALSLDVFSAPLVPLVALLFLLAALATPRAKMRRFSFSLMLVSEGITLAMLACREPWLIIALSICAALPPYFELKARRKPTRVFALHMTLFGALLILGWTFIELEGRLRTHTLWAVLPLLAAVLIRSGVAPVHCWVTDLFEHATFGAALLFVLPMTGAYLAVRLVLPIAPDWILRTLALLSLATAVYGAGMALVQREARRFFCFVFLSHSALVLVGLESLNPIGLTGALALWLSVGLSLGGFGITLRALEARHGRLSLAGFHGVYEHTPLLAVCFLLMGLASVGFPGTLGFLATELLVDGAVQAFPLVGIAVVAAGALNGIAVMQAYFRLFTGAKYATAVPLSVSGRVRLALLSLAALILGGALFPQPGIESRHHAAEQILEEHAALRSSPQETPVSKLSVSAQTSEEPPRFARDYKLVK